MAFSIGTPIPDCGSRRTAARSRHAALDPLSDLRGTGVTQTNGEETDYGLGFAANYHKGLPHAVDGSVHAASYHLTVWVLARNETGAVETLPVGSNRRGVGSPEDPPRYTTPATKNGKPIGYRKLTSPFTGHVYERQGADSAAFAIAPAPRLDSDELAAEVAELYAMALLRDVPFTAIESGGDPIGANGDTARVHVTAPGGQPVTSEQWYSYET